MNTFMLKTMPILCHEIHIDVGDDKEIKVLQDFNCRFTATGYLLFTNFVAARGCYTWRS